MRELTTVRKINEACLAAAMGRGGQVYADTKEIEGTARWRITRARTHYGALEGKTLATGTWVRIHRAYTD